MIFKTWGWPGFRAIQNSRSATRPHYYTGRLALGCHSVVAGLIAGWLMALNATAQTVPDKVLPGHVPAVVATLTAKGGVPATNQIRLAIGLPLHHVGDLNDLLARLYDPASSDFHQYLTPAEFTARFGPTEGEYEAVKQFARTNGLTVGGTYENRLVLDVSGPAAAVEQALHVTLRTYRHPTEARDFYAPDTEPTVAGDLPVVDVQGLSNFARPHPRSHRKGPGSVKAGFNGGSAPDGSGNYIGDDFRNAYVPGTTLTGAGQEIGLFEADGFYASDIAEYAAMAGGGRGNIAIQTVLLDGYDGTPTTGTQSGNGEVSLDIELAMALAPGLSKIVVYEGNPNYFLENDILNAMLAGSSTVKNLSSSWDWDGGPSKTTDTIFTNMAILGQSFFSAAGDSDAFTPGAKSVNGVDNPDLRTAPLSSPIITLVGGTTLTMNGLGASYNTEQVWNWNYDAEVKAYLGSSGGISSHYSIPNWQTNINMPARGGSASFRNTPDVALTADNIYVTSGNGQSGGYGGTSCAAPLWAAFVALANQQAATGGKPVVGFLNPALYTIANGTNYAACFHDVTTGSNCWPGSPALFYATNGYDLCTGLGTPNGTNLINALVGPPDLLVIVPATGFSASGLVGGPFSPTSKVFYLTNIGTTALGWAISNTPAWLNVSLTQGTLPAGGATNVTVGLNSVATNQPEGNYSVNLLCADLNSGLQQSRQFSLQVIEPLQITPALGFTSFGPVGGPFNTNSEVFALTNIGPASLNWSAVNPSLWFNVSPGSGTLAAGVGTRVTVGLNPADTHLAVGNYSVPMGFSNQTDQVEQDGQFTVVVSTNLVQDGGFETGTFSSWTTANGNFNASALINFVDDGSVSGISPYEGGYFAGLGENGSLADLSQTLPTTAGRLYLISLWLYPDPQSANTNQFKVSWGGSTLFNQTNLDSGATSVSWTNLQFWVVAANSNLVLQIGARDDKGLLGLDAISVTAEAPPVPTGLSGAAGNEQVALAWNASLGTASYTVARSLTNGGAYTLIANTTTTNYTDAAVVNGATYYYVVAAVNSTGQSADSTQISATPVPDTVSWTGSQNDAWSYTVYNWNDKGAFSVYADGDNVVFNDYSYSYSVVINGSVYPGTVTFANASADYNLSTSGGGIAGTTGLIKTNNGTLSLGNANTYTGGTTIGGGALLVNNTSGSATGSGGVTVAGGWLGGTGMVAGAVTVGAGGALVPGNPLGTLTISNNLTLAAGSAAWFQVQHSPLTNSSAVVLGTLTEGGALTVTNTGGTALAKGDGFSLFNAGSYAGSFARLVLPALPTGLVWSTNTLNATGALTVVMATPEIASAAVLQGGLVFQGGGGAAGGSFYLLGASNLSLPMIHWTRLLTNAFDSNGNFDFTNPIATNAPQGFFRLQVP